VASRSACGTSGHGWALRPIELAEFFTDDVIRGLLANSLETAELGTDGFTDIGAGPDSTEAKYIDWLPIGQHRERRRGRRTYS
jgi:hypothetical protein